MSLKRLQREVVLRLALLVCAAGLMFWGIACDDDPPMKPPPVLGEITLTLEDVGVTEAVIRVAFPDSIGYWTLSLRRDGQMVRTLTVQRRDTILTDQELTPSQTYIYQVVRMIDSMTVKEKSNELRVTTKSVSSSAFHWRLDSLAGGTSSALFDVAIIRTDPPLIYAVGEMYKSGESKLYNLAVWKGQEWELKRVTAMFRGNPVTVRIEGIFAHSETDIWLAGGLPIHGDGDNWTLYDPRAQLGDSVSVSRVWGTEKDMYFVGHGGTILHFNGTSWRRIISGTTLPFRGLYGAPTKDGTDYEILCVGDGYMEPEGSKVFSIREGRATLVWTDRRQYGLDDIWFIPGKRYIVVGDGFWETDSLSKPFTKRDVLTSAAKHSIYGIDNRDIFAAGSFKLLAHFNGYKWTSFFPFSSGGFGSVKMKGDLVVAVGADGRYALTAIGRR